MTRRTLLLALGSGLLSAGIVQCGGGDGSSAQPAPGVVTVLVVDADGRPVPGVSVSFSPAAGASSPLGDEPRGTVMTDANGSAAASLPFGGAVTAGPVTVREVENGDVIHVGPVARTGPLVLHASITLPANSPNVSVAAGNCGMQGTLDAGVQPYSYDATLYYQGGTFRGDQQLDPPLRDWARCASPGDHVGVSVIASSRGVPQAIALKDVMFAPRDGGSSTAAMVVSASEWQPLSPGTMQLTGTQPPGLGAARVDFPFPFSRLPGAVKAAAGRTVTYFVPPASVAPEIVVTTRFTGGDGGPPGPICSWTTAHARRIPSTTTIVEPLDDLLPVFQYQGCAPLGLAKPLPHDSVGVCLYPAVVLPLRAGATSFPIPCSDQLIIDSPQLPYALARQYPTALTDPESIFGQILTSGEADLHLTYGSHGQAP